MSESKDDETSTTLLVRIQGGEMDAWRRLVRLYEPLVHYWCRRWGVDGEGIKDVTQEIWLALGPNLANYQPGPGRSFKGWLRGVARHKTQHWHRRRSHQLAEAEGGSIAIQILGQVKAEDDIMPDPGEVNEEKALLRRAVLFIQAEFEEKTWKAFLASAVDGRATADIAAELGMTTAAVRTAKSRVLNRLRLELGELLD
jgi:RNA polymerase sigma-70 factor (ECF subfamily)